MFPALLALPTSNPRSIKINSLTDFSKKPGENNLGGIFTPFTPFTPLTPFNPLSLPANQVMKRMQGSVKMPLSAPWYMARARESFVSMMMMPVIISTNAWQALSKSYDA